MMNREPEFGDSRETQVVGHPMVTEQGETIGKVNDLLIDESDTADGQWAVVSTGMLRADRFVPLASAYVATDGNVVVPYDKETVKRAPSAKEHVLSPAVRKELADYYGTVS